MARKRTRRAQRPPTVWRVPDDLWKRIAVLLPIEECRPTGGRQWIPPRRILDGIVYVLRTGCQWKAVPAEYGSGSTVHRRFQRWVALGCFEAIWRRLLQHYDDEIGLQWRWQSADASLHKAPHGGETNRPQPYRLHVSHEAIYRSLFIQARGVLKQELLRHLRSQRTLRRARTATRTGQRRGQIVGAVSIRERPAEAADRAVPGHWEGDLLAGGPHSHIATLVERQSRFTLLVKVPGGGKDTASVIPALARQMRTLPTALRRSLTWDRGLELTQHTAFTVATDVQVYFCDPQSPWQRGTNENTNGLLRQYLPKGTDLTVHSQADLNRIAHRLNTRPRETLGYRTPAAMLAATLR